MFGVDVVGFLGLVCQTCVTPPPNAQGTPIDIGTVLGAGDIPNPSQTICGQIISAVDNEGALAFLARDAYECLLSVPFYADPAVRFIEYYNTTMQFHSTIPYLKSPPEEYQQPAFDFYAELSRIKQNALNNAYKNQYEFEADMQGVVYAFHDGHVDLVSGILAAFSFSSPYYITSASPDGKAVPKVYITDDILAHRDGYTVSAISSINDQHPDTYLTAFAALNSIGTLEPHADYNQLMSYPAQQIMGALNAFSGGATFYPGDTLVFKFENGSSLETQWVAYYNEVDLTGPLKTPGDFYNYFVLGLLPAACDPECPLNDPIVSTSKRQDDNEGGESELQSWSETSFGAYPDPDVVQRDLSVTGGGVLTGYFLNDSSTAVLSIPTFELYGYDIGNFSASVSEFITRAKEAKIKRVVIDLQQNPGGSVFLAYDTFKQFFPELEPFAGSRRHIQDMANFLGTVHTTYWDSLANSDDEVAQYNRSLLAADEWVITDRLNADTKAKFQSWAEYAGPRTFLDTTYSLTERYNLSDLDFAAAAFDNWVAYGYGPENQISTERPWNPEDIVLLTDGLCSSACVVFAEMMSYQGGVKTIVAGGRPHDGPMQAASGSRGARLYSADLLDVDFDYASGLSTEAASILPQNRDSAIFTNYAGFNLRDQIRDGDNVPLQFKYLAADCRIYYTLDNAYNMTQLWLDAVQATWNDTTLCVQGSTGHTAAKDATPDLAAPPKEALVQVEEKHVIAGADAIISTIDVDVGITAGPRDVRSTPSIQLCTSAGGCPSNSKCTETEVRCANGEYKLINVCLQKCNNRNAASGCSGSTYCHPLALQNSKVSTLSEDSTLQGPNGGVSNQLYSGVCEVGQDSSALRSLGCPRR
ncbi:hypothetical protein EJ05DRAFT_473618 [Pseudovirgaria hyperparasitica]|uniref:Uncharacterized protein n=1 Tax=Pseudovirgaria hyperparasitica TaxID=470096 RepID=A0A6A6WGG9_9PEZI|nr:uncharacterized protein EJ05DRAFT_473618 [Pseudovirgaria hyperparasitica]KAF2761056.1 hypothetical protein EJ05DRAFT_473618 [Pseudovirgaria hyperparasitica]